MYIYTGYLYVDQQVTTKFLAVAERANMDQGLILKISNLQTGTVLLSYKKYC